MNFEEDRIVGEVRLQALEAVTYNNLWECFPYSLEKPDPITVTLHDANGQQINGNNVIASTIMFRTTANEVHIITFDQPRLCSIGVNTSVDDYGTPHTCGRVLTSLPLQWNANQTQTFSWEMKVVHLCPDINVDGLVDGGDLVAVLLAWGPCPGDPAPCPANVKEPFQGEGQNEVNGDDLIEVVMNWGRCDS
jgi:hypothetical protein